MKKTITTLLLGCSVAFSSWGAPSILDIKHSITDDNVIAPESFETKTRELEENFYILNYIAPDAESKAAATTGTATEYEQRLAKLPTVIEMPYNSIVGKFIDMYLVKKRGLVADMLALHNYYGNIFLEELLKEGMPTELQYLPVIESALNPNAISRAGAAGLWQFMPATAKGLGMEVNSLVDERRDPVMSSRNAAKYLKQLYEIYHDWSLAIAAYNCGPGNVNKAIRRAGGTDKMDFWEIYDYLPSETRGYVPAFIAANYVMNYYRNHGIRPTVVKRQLITDTIVVNKYVHFNQIAAILNIPVEEIKMLNPQFLGDIIPGDYRPYTLTLPKQQCLSYVMSEPVILEYDAPLYARRTRVEPGESSAPVIVSDNGDANLALMQQQSTNAGDNKEVALLTEQMVRKTHVVTRGENIRDIARQYGVSATDIKRWNHLRRGKVKEGDELVIEIHERVAPDEVAVVKREEIAATAPASAPAEKKNPVTVTGGATRKPASASTNADASQPSKQTRKERVQAQQNSNTKKTSTPQTTSYKVKSGDSLDRLAKKFGTTVSDIQAANGMKKSDTRINIGQTLKIPAKKSSAAKSSTKKKSRRRR